MSIISELYVQCFVVVGQSAGTASRLKIPADKPRRFDSGRQVLKTWLLEY